MRGSRGLRASNSSANSSIRLSDERVWDPDLPPSTYSADKRSANLLVALKRVMAKVFESAWKTYLSEAPELRHR